MAGNKNPKVPAPGFPGAKNIIKPGIPGMNNLMLINAVTSTKAALDAAEKAVTKAQKDYDAAKNASGVFSSPIRSFSAPTINVTLVHQTEGRFTPITPVFVTGLSTFNGLWDVVSLPSHTEIVYRVPLKGWVAHPSTLSKGEVFSDTVGGGAVRKLNGMYLALASSKSKLKEAKDAYAQAKKAAGKLVTSATGSGSKSDVPAPTIVTGSDRSAVTYNIPSVKEAYFSGSASNGEIADARTSTYDTNVLFVDAGNRPAKVDEAQSLWMDNQAHKGMFQTFIVPKADATKNIGSNTKGVKGRQAQQNVANVGRYGFQFLYNPGTIQMGYAGAPDIDPGLMMSNQQMIPLIGAANTSSAVSFNLILNRMPDMKYLNSVDKKGIPTMSSSDFLEVYGRTPPENYQSSLQKIRDTGTMYDVEFLLQTLLGYEAWSTLRNRYSSDIGYIGSFPVELHLGKSLRYVVLVQDISVTHTIFTKDMVPVYSNISIVAGRLPDSGFNTLLHSYTPPKTAVQGGGGGGLSTNFRAT